MGMHNYNHHLFQISRHISVTVLLSYNANQPFQMPQQPDAIKTFWSHFSKLIQFTAVLQKQKLSLPKNTIRFLNFYSIFMTVGTMNGVCVIRDSLTFVNCNPLWLHSIKNNKFTPKCLTQVFKEHAVEISFLS